MSLYRHKLLSEIKNKYQLSRSETKELESDIDTLLKDAIKMCYEHNCNRVEAQLFQRIGDRIYFKVHAMVDIKHDLFQIDMLSIPKGEYHKEVFSLKAEQN